jgi:error-prone DNA polymerase
VPLFQEQLLRMAMVAAGFTGGEAEELRRAMGFKRSEKRMQQIEGKLREGMAKHGITGGGRSHRPVDHVVRAVRLSRVARGQLRAARLCERVPEGALPGGVLHGAAQQPADGVLPPGHAREGRAAPRRALRAHRRAGVRLACVPRRGHDRRSALWQIERAVRPAGELFEGVDSEEGDDVDCPGGVGPFAGPGERRSPLQPMTRRDRVVADYAGTGLTIGPHPMAFEREGLALRGVLRAADLSAARSGRRVRVAGAVITRQRPGTAKGFVFLTLEDETGIANVIVRPDLFDRARLSIVGEPFLVIEGVLQQQDGVTSVRAERVAPLGARQAPRPGSHDFR